MNIISEEIKSYMKEVGGIFISPWSIGIEDDEKILQTDEDGWLVETDLEGLPGRFTRHMNHREFVGDLRSAVEQLHCIFDQEDLWSRQLDRHLMDPIGPKMVQDFK